MSEPIDGVWDIKENTDYYIQTFENPPDIVSIQDSNGQEILSIASNGQVTWHQEDKADDAAEMFTQAITRSVEKIAEIKQSREEWEARILKALISEAENAPLTPEALTDVVRKCIMIDKLKGIK